MTTITMAPIAVDGKTAAEILGNLGYSTFLAKVAAGELPKPRKVGARSMWLVEELQAAARSLPISDDTPLPKSPQAA